MATLQLQRSRDDRASYEIEGVGTLRLGGLFGGAATAEAGGQRWELVRAGFWRQLQARDAVGSVVGTFERRLLRSNSIHWNGREYHLGRASVWRERYALADGDREIALLDGKGWGRRPVAIDVEETLDPGLLLFATFVVHTLARESSDGSSAASVAATG
jgi:hypothetical protein